MKKAYSFLIVLVLSLALTGCKTSGELTFELVSENLSTYKIGQEYIEYGFIAKSGAKDISNNVTITNNIDINNYGDYEVTYTVDYKDISEEFTRKIYYREELCNVNYVNGITQCDIIWSEYLHTVVKIRLYYEENDMDGQIHDIFSGIEEIVQYYHIMSDKYTYYKTSRNVHYINENAGDTIVIDQELFDLIKFSLDHQPDVNNLFNIALGPVLKVWHEFRENCNNDPTRTNCFVPTSIQLNNQKPYTDPSKIILDEEAVSITLEENMSIDLGGVSKGYISDKILEYIDQFNLSGYLINNGESNISIGGTHPTRENDKFLLAVKDPSYDFFTSPDTWKTYYATVYIGAGEQLVTSGDYQQFYEVDGELYHHIIHNDTLFPERYCRSVSIVHTDPALADIYSTAIFLMPISEGVAFVDSIDGLEAIWFGLDGTISYSENFEANYLDKLYNQE
ncbi:FAD:protein FMN transferase [Candidatus Izimaplasma bacterium]|nr:FAD:protein FMN transferase [Candidatus Izimaplasma bacterium]